LHQFTAIDVHVRLPQHLGQAPIAVGGVETELMARAILSLAGFEIGGGWLLVSTLGVMPIVAYGMVASIVAVVVAFFILRASWSRPNGGHHRGGFGRSSMHR